MTIASRFTVPATFQGDPTDTIFVPFIGAGSTVTNKVTMTVTGYEGELEYTFDLNKFLELARRLASVIGE